MFIEYGGRIRRLRPGADPITIVFRSIKPMKTSQENPVSGVTVYRVEHNAPGKREFTRHVLEYAKAHDQLQGLVIFTDECGPTPVEFREHVRPLKLSGALLAIPKEAA